MWFMLVILLNELLIEELRIERAKLLILDLQSTPGDFRHSRDGHIMLR